MSVVLYSFFRHTDMYLKTTLTFDDKLLDQARELTGIRDNRALVRAGLEALIDREAGKRLALLGGTNPKLSDIRRRRQPQPAS